MKVISLIRLFFKKMILLSKKQQQQQNLKAVLMKLAQGEGQETIQSCSTSGPSLNQSDWSTIAK